jgi:hypothetical protein
VHELRPPVPQPALSRLNTVRRHDIAQEVEAMAERNEQDEAAQSAALARKAIAERIKKLVSGVKDDAGAQIVLHLAEAYANLAAEPPRVRAN